MGYNRSGTRRTKRMKRRKRHEMRLFEKAAQQQPQEEGVLSKVKSAARHAAEKVGEAASAARHAAETAGEKVASAAKHAAEKVSEAARSVVDTVKDKMS